MKEITIDVLKDAANRLLFDMSEDEYQTLYDEFMVLKKQMETIGLIEGLDGYEPMTFPFDVHIDCMREDIPETPLGKQEALSNAGSTYQGQIKIAKVV